MPVKNDISAYKVGVKPKLRAMVTPSSDNTATYVVSSASFIVGRKPRPKAYKQSEIVSLRLTPSEAAMLKKKADLVPVATYVKHCINTDTDLLK